MLHYFTESETISLYTATLKSLNVHDNKKIIFGLSYSWTLVIQSKSQALNSVIKLTVAKSQIFRVLSSEAETSSFESDDQDTSEIPWKNASKLGEAQVCLQSPVTCPLERLSMMFTADGKQQRLPLIFYSFLVILK